MKAILHKRQIQTIMLLTAVIFILLCGVAYTVSTRRTTDAITTPVDAEKPPHELVRNARASANERIVWETNIGGSGNETPVSVFRKNNEIYVFGNTDSNDADFVGLTQGKRRGFGARLSIAGRTLAFTVFDFTVIKAIPTLSGFAVAGNEGSVAGLYLLSDALTVTGQTAMPATHELTAVGLYVFDNRYFLAAESLDEITGKKSILLHIYTMGLAREREKVFSHTYGLQFLDILPYADGYILAAAAQFQDLGYLTVARFSTIGEPAYTDVDLGYAYTPTAFLPLGGGYAAVCDNAGKCELLLLSAELRKTDLKFLTEKPNANEKTLFYAGATYAYTGEKLVELSDDGRTVGAVDFAPNKITSFCRNEAAAFAAGVSDTGIEIAMIGKTATQTVCLQADAPTRVLLCAGGTDLLFAADTHAATPDCGDWFGGADVWIGKTTLSATQTP